MCMPSRVMLWDMSCHTGSDTYTLTGAANGTQAVMCLCCSLSPTHTHKENSGGKSLCRYFCTRKPTAHTHTYTHTQARTHTRTHTCLHARTHTHTHACLHARTYTHAYTHKTFSWHAKKVPMWHSQHHLHFICGSQLYTADKGGTGHAQETSHHSYLH